MEGGASVGAACGPWLAGHHPVRVASLALVCSSARFGEPAPWRERAERVREEGVGGLADTAPARWFTPGFAGTGTARALAARVLREAPGPYPALPLSFPDLVSDLLALDSELAEPRVRPEELRTWADGLLRTRQGTKLTNADRFDV